MEKGMNFFFDRYKEMGQDPHNIKLPDTIRVNTLKISEKEMISRLEKRNVRVTPSRTIKHCLQTSSKFSIGSTVEYLLGLYYVQSAAAQIPVQILFEDNKTPDLVLDMCAAPGGKTTQIAQYTNADIIALDIKPNRLEALKNNLERLNISNVTVFNMDAKKADQLDMKFDKILLDAPCSGNFITDKNWFQKRTLSGIKKQAKLQYELLELAFKVLNKNGILVYSTCSLEPEENEYNIHNFLKNHKDMKLENIRLNMGLPSPVNLFSRRLNPEINKCIRFWPWKTGTEGFFIAKLRKK